MHFLTWTKNEHQFIGPVLTHSLDSLNTHQNLWFDLVSLMKAGKINNNKNIKTQPSTISQLHQLLVASPCWQNNRSQRMWRRKGCGLAWKVKKTDVGGSGELRHFSDFVYRVPHSICMSMCAQCVTSSPTYIKKICQHKHHSQAYYQFLCQWGQWD